MFPRWGAYLISVELAKSLVLCCAEGMHRKTKVCAQGNLKEESRRELVGVEAAKGEIPDQLVAEVG